MADANYTGQTKFCSTCGTEKPATVDFFHPNIGGKFGLRGQCKDCRNESVRASLKRPEIAAKRRELNEKYCASGKNAEIKKAWREKNIEKARTATARWKVNNPELAKGYEQRWRSENRDKVRAKQRRADAKLQTKPVHVLNKRIKSRIRSMLKGNVVIAKGSIGSYLRFTKEELVTHIERQFTKGMTWDKLVAGEIHIDHIIPVSSFNIVEIGDSEFLACWDLSNLRPLWNVENWSKHAKILSLL